MKKKILFYNWDELIEGKNRGGGVTVYLKNLIRELIDMDEYDIYYLASGREYDIDKCGMYIKQTDNCFGDACKSFFIVNSPCLASANLNFNNIRTAIKNEKIVKTMEEFICEYGPFDIIHFHNLEGISFDVLDLKQKYKMTKFIYSLHNYYPFCPQVNLWAKSSVNCFGNETGCACTECMPTDTNVEKVKKKLALNRKMLCADSEEEKRELEERISEIDAEYAGLDVQIDLSDLEQDMALFKKSSVEKINKNIDVVLAVSDKTRQIAVALGIDEEKIETNYIGTKISEYQVDVPRKRVKRDFLRIIYMGQMRKEKGFYFFLEALEEISDELAGKLEIVVAARKSDKDAVLRLEKLRKRYKDVAIIDGYRHEELQEILSDIDFGVVPVLWEDNLPQVAIEMTAFGIPVLSSNLGGTKEIAGSNMEFVYYADDKKDFVKKIKEFSENPLKLNNYWKHYRGALTMEKHVTELKEKYYE